MKPMNANLRSLGTTIFTTMSALAAEHGAINLGQGFPDTDGPDDIKQHAAAAILEQSNQYAPLCGTPALRAAVSAANKRFYGLDYDPGSEIIVTSGATEALAGSLMALIDPGDEVVLIEPLYDTYYPMVRQLGGVPKIVRLAPPDWTLDRAALEAAFGPKTKAILFNSPMNPIGKLFSDTELGWIAELLQKYDAYAICDEVYEHLVFNGVHKPLACFPGMRDRCIRIGSAGKTFSLTGWKVGYMSAPKAIAANLAKAHQLLTFVTPPALQQAVAFGLAKEEAYFTELAQSMGRKRDRLAAGLQACGLPVLPGDGTYFLVADISALGETDVDFCRRMTIEAKVTPIPISAFYAENPPSHLVRFAFCKQDHVLDEAIARLKSCLKR